ncbi:hypothetical protein [Paenibacillus massiliensis]|uniref:hypothetical protein n=1 Tax=Paenibacillus massiliensis TaxID=225917 RepID=UPI00047296CF|nr:hypothetical protein [Paenibacillus massiliensis]
MNYVEYQQSVSINLTLFLRENGYTRLSFSKLTDVPRTIVDQLLSGWSGDESECNMYVEKIRHKFELPVDYFLKDVTLLPSPKEQLRPEIQELYDGLDNILDIYSLYIN